MKTIRCLFLDIGGVLLSNGWDHEFRQQAVAHFHLDGEISRGIAICGSGIGACIAANKIAGVTSALITDSFSAHQGVENDNMNVMCLGGRITGPSLAWKSMQTFINAGFKNEERFLQRSGKVTALERDKD